MPTKIADKEALKELHNVLLAVEPEFPPEIWLGRIGSDRELFFLYNAQPHMFFYCGDRENPLQNTLVIPDEMMALKVDRGLAFKVLIRAYVASLKEMIDAIEVKAAGE